MENEKMLLRYSRFSYRLSVIISCVYILFGLFTLIAVKSVPSLGEQIGLITQKKESAAPIDVPFIAFSNLTDSFVDFIYFIIFAVFPLLSGVMRMINDIFTKFIRLRSADASNIFKSVAQLNNNNLGLIASDFMLTFAFTKQGIYFSVLTSVNILFAVILIIFIIKRPKLPKSEIPEEDVNPDNEEYRSEE